MISMNGSNKAAFDSDVQAEIDRRVADRKREREERDRAEIESEVRAQAEHEAQLQRAIEQRDDAFRRRDAAQAELDELGKESSKLRALFEQSWQRLAAKQLELTSIHGSCAAAEATVERLKPNPLRDLRQFPTAKRVIAAIGTLHFDDSAPEGIEFQRRRVVRSDFALVEALGRAISKLRGEELSEVNDYLYSLGLSAGRQLRDMR
jgi:hypothetical protein